MPCKMEKIDSDFWLRGIATSQTGLCHYEGLFFPTFDIFYGFCPLESRLGQKTAVLVPVYTPEFLQHSLSETLFLSLLFTSSTLAFLLSSVQQRRSSSRHKPVWIPGSRMVKALQKDCSLDRSIGVCLKMLDSLAKLLCSRKEKM